MKITFNTLIFSFLFIIFSSNTGLAQIPLDGLVGHYMMDGIPADSSGMDHHGTIVDQVTPTTNRIGEIDKALLFEGGHINTGDPLAYQLTDNISISAWIMPTLIDNWSGIVTRWASQTDGGYYLGINPDNFSIRWNIGAPPALDGEALVIGEWSHLAATYDGVSTKIYQNGILISTEAISTPIATPFANFIIGSQSNILTSSFNGAIDDVLIYNRDLGQAGIDSIYNSPESDTRDIVFDRPVSLYPSLTSGITNIKNNSDHQILSYTLCNASGQAIRKGAFQKQLDLSNQASGMYYLILHFGDGTMTKKVIRL